LKSLTNIFIAVAVIFVLIVSLFNSDDSETQLTQIPIPVATPSEQSTLDADTGQEDSKQKKSSPALRALANLPIRGRAPKTGYSREMFADDWDYSFGCDTRNRILRRDLVQYSYRSDSSCIIERGVLEDPFTGQTINFQRGVRTSLEVQIDHVVSLSDAWQKGAQSISSYQRYLFYNDPLNLLAVYGPANSQKSDSDAASWLPSNTSFRCAFVARQLAVKLKYGLSATQAEHDTMGRVLSDCPKQKLPTG
jgi:hypothetical protein